MFLKEQSKKVWYSSTEEVPDEVKKSGIRILTKIQIIFECTESLLPTHVKQCRSL